MRSVILGKTAESVLKGFPLAKNELTKDINSAVRASKEIKFPLVLKIYSKQIVHKSDIGGVKVIKDIEELKKEYIHLVNIAKKRKFKLSGILLQEFVQGKELIIGIKKDATFNHVIMFGIGGIYTEILKDVSFRICPITEHDAEAMINELKTKQLLLGARGEKPVDLKLLKSILVKVSKLPDKYKAISELDINPFIINDRIGKIVDIRIVMEK